MAQDQLNIEDPEHRFRTMRRELKFRLLRKVRLSGPGISAVAEFIRRAITILLLVVHAAPVRAVGARSSDTPLDQAKFEPWLNAQVAPDQTFRDDAGGIVRRRGAWIAERGLRIET